MLRRTCASRVRAPPGSYVRTADEGVLGHARIAPLSPEGRRATETDRGAQGFLRATVVVEVAPYIPCG